MLKQSSSRNQRSKGFKVKHALQVCLLVAVCVWLLYQVKHSHDKKKALEESSMKILTAAGRNIPENFKFGRKDLPQVNTETDVDMETHGDDEGNDEADEAEPEVKHEEIEEEETKGTGEDEIDENDQEGTAEEADPGEESGDEEEKDGLSNELELLGNKDHDSDEANSQEAREEHYRGDDASSAVIRDTEKAESEAENLENGNVNEERKENTEMDLEIGNKTTGSEDGGKVDVSGVFLEKSEVDLVNNSSMNENHLMEGANSTSLESTDQSEQQNISTEETLPIASMEMQNNSTVLVDTENNSSSLQNSTIDIDLALGQNSTIKFETSADDKNSSLAEDGDPNSQKILMEQAENSNMTYETQESEEGSKASSISTEGDTGEGGNEAATQIETNDPLARADLVPEEEVDTRADLSTLPDSETETKIEDVAAE